MDADALARRCADRMYADDAASQALGITITDVAAGSAIAAPRHRSFVASHREDRRGLDPNTVVVPQVTPDVPQCRHVMLTVRPNRGQGEASCSGTSEMRWR